MKLKADKQTSWAEEIDYQWYDGTSTHQFEASRWNADGCVWMFEITLSYKHGKLVQGLLALGTDVNGRELPMKLSRQIAKALDTPRKRRLAAVLKVVNSIKENP